MGYIVELFYQQDFRFWYKNIIVDSFFKPLIMLLLLDFFWYISYALTFYSLYFLSLVYQGAPLAVLQDLETLLLKNSQVV